MLFILLCDLAKTPFKISHTYKRMCFIDCFTRLFSSKSDKVTTTPNGMSDDKNTDTIHKKCQRERAIHMINTYKTVLMLQYRRSLMKEYKRQSLKENAIREHTAP
jgi:hypothetical protein